MALTVDQLREALRAGDSLEEKTQVARLLAFCTGEVERIAITAPATAKNEAIIRAAGYLYDMPSITGLAQANAMRNSGALAILLPYRVHRAGTIGEAVTMAQDSGSPGNPVISITIAGNQLVVTYADGNITTETLPAGGDADLSQVATWAHTADASQIPANKLANAPGGGGVSIAQAVALIDSVVEDWAEVGDGTQIPANKLANAPDGGGTGDDAAAWAEVGNTDQIPRNKLGNAQSGTLTSGLFNGRLPGPERTVAIGWSQTQDGDELVFIRANMHPEDGANSTGESSVGMLIPPFPPALVGDNTLFQHVWTDGDGPVVQITDTGYDNPAAALSYFDPPVPLVLDGSDGQLFVSTIRQFKPVDNTFISFTFGDGPLVASLADVYDWAETDNTDPIPADKLTLAPDGGGTGDDAATWAEEGNTDLIPAGKLLNAPAGMGISSSEAIAIVETAVEDWAETGDSSQIPGNKLLNAPAGNGGGGGAILQEEPPLAADALPGRLYGVGPDGEVDRFYFLRRRLRNLFYPLDDSGANSIISVDQPRNGERDGFRRILFTPGGAFPTDQGFHSPFWNPAIFGDDDNFSYANGKFYFWYRRTDRLEPWVYIPLEGSYDSQFTDADGHVHLYRTWFSAPMLSILPFGEGYTYRLEFVRSGIGTRHVLAWQTQLGMDRLASVTDALDLARVSRLKAQIISHMESDRVRDLAFLYRSESIEHADEQIATIADWAFAANPDVIPTNKIPGQSPPVLLALGRIDSDSDTFIFDTTGDFGSEAELLAAVELFNDEFRSITAVFHWGELNTPTFIQYTLLIPTLDARTHGSTDNPNGAFAWRVSYRLDDDQISAVDMFWQLNAVPPAMTMHGLAPISADIPIGFYGNT